ncbi:unnamed protein product, partial [Didymodactylos carnosus]
LYNLKRLTTINENKPFPNVNLLYLKTYDFVENSTDQYFANVYALVLKSKASFNISSDKFVNDLSKICSLSNLKCLTLIENMYSTDFLVELFKKTSQITSLRCSSEVLLTIMNDFPQLAHKIKDLFITLYESNSSKIMKKLCSMLINIQYLSIKIANTNDLYILLPIILRIMVRQKLNSLTIILYFTEKFESLTLMSWLNDYICLNSVECEVDHVQNSGCLNMLFSDRHSTFLI